MCFAFHQEFRTTILKHFLVFVIVHYIAPLDYVATISVLVYYTVKQHFYILNSKHCPEQRSLFVLFLKNRPKPSSIQPTQERFPMANLPNSPYRLAVWTKFNMPLVFTFTHYGDPYLVCNVIMCFNWNFDLSTLLAPNQTACGPL